MPTVQEILRTSGMTDEQINGLDKKIFESFGSVLTTAEQERNAAEVARRAQQQQYEKDIAPALNTWATEKANLEAQVAFYRTQNEKAREGGFVPQDAPGYTPQNPNQPRNPQTGQYVAGENDVPGSPKLVEQIRGEVGGALSVLTDVSWEYQSLFGSPLPEPPSKLAAEAEAQRLPFKDYVERKFNFAGKREEIARKKQEDHDTKVRQEAAAERDRYWSERTGNNPDVRMGVESEFSTVRKATAEGQRKDPLLMNETERRAATRAAIRSDVSEGNRATA